MLQIDAENSNTGLLLNNYINKPQHQVTLLFQKLYLQPLKPDPMFSKEEKCIGISYITDEIHCFITENAH